MADGLDPYRTSGPRHGARRGNADGLEIGLRVALGFVAAWASLRVLACTFWGFDLEGLVALVLASLTIRALLSARDGSRRTRGS